MSSKGYKPVLPGDVVSFRLPPDTSNAVLKQLNSLKQSLGRNYSSKLAKILLEAIEKQISSNVSLRVPLPDSITSEQIEWLENPMTQRLLQQVILQLADEPGSAIQITPISKVSDVIPTVEIVGDSDITNTAKASKPYSSKLQAKLFANLSN